MEEWVQCPNGCGEKLFHKEVSAHVRSLCPDRKDPCECGMLIRSWDSHRTLSPSNAPRQGPTTCSTGDGIGPETART